MNPSEIGARYAKALYQLAEENHQQDAIFDQLRALGEALQTDKTIADFVSSPLIRPQEKEKAFGAALKGLSVNDLVKTFVLVLAHKQRLDVFPAILKAYQDLADEKHGVVRGVVRSTTVLAPEQRKQIEEKVNRVTHKQPLLTYKEDPTLLGGLLAEVGSYTFDDSLASHLRRMKEQLTQRSHQ